MGRKKELARNTIILTIGKMCTQFISFLLLPLYTTFLSTEEYGIFDLFATFCAVLIPLITWQLDQGLFRFLIEDRKNQLRIKSIFSSIFIVYSLQSIAITVIYYCASIVFWDSEYKIYLLLSVIVNMFLGLLMQFARGIGKMLCYSISSFISAVSTIIYNILFIVVFNMGAHGLFLATILGVISSCLYLIFYLRIWKYISIKYFSIDILKPICIYSIPMIPNQISGWVLSTSDRMIIYRFLNISANGIYSVANKFSNLICTFFGFFNLAWVEMVSVHFDDEDRDMFISELIQTVFNIFFTCCIGIMCLMPFVFSMIVRGDYGEAYYQIPILLIASVFQVLFGLYSAIYIALKKSTSIAKTTILGGIINIVVNLCLINSIGLYAASISTFLSFAFVAIYRGIDIRKYLTIRLNKVCMFTNTVVVVIVMITYYINISVTNYISLLLVCIYSIIINRNLIKMSGSEIIKLLNHDD